MFIIALVEAGFSLITINVNYLNVQETSSALQLSGFIDIIQLYTLILRQYTLIDIIQTIRSIKIMQEKKAAKLSRTWAVGKWIQHKYPTHYVAHLLIIKMYT